MDDAKGECKQSLRSAKYGGRVLSGNGGKTWRARFRSQGKHIFLASQPTEEQAARALSMALCKAGQESNGLPQLSDADKAELDAMSMEQLLERFKAAGSALSQKTSCYRGVSWNEADGKWRAQIYSNRHRKHLGMFTSEEEAAQAYDYAALAKHGKDAKTNFPAEQYYADGSSAKISYNASECHVAPLPSPGKDSTDLYRRDRPKIPVGPWPALTGLMKAPNPGDFPRGEQAEVQQQGTSAGQGVLTNVSVVPAASASNAVPTLSEGSMSPTDSIPGYHAPDWESWGDGGAFDDVDAIEFQAGAYNAIHWAAVSEDEADDEFLNTVPGLTEQDIEDYMACGRLEPNLHIFTNPLYPPYDTDLEHAQHASWLAFLAAKDSTDPAVWNAADAAGENLLRAYAENDTSDDDEDTETAVTGSPHRLAEAPPVVLKPGSGWHQINGTWIRRVALPEDKEFQGFGPYPVPGAVAETSPMSNTNEPTPKRIKTSMQSTDGRADAGHSAGDIVAKVKELTGKMAEAVASYKEGELPFWVVEAESAQMQADFDAFMGRPQRDYSKPPSDGAGRVSQAEILELERGEEAARHPNAVITQAGRYKIRTASNGDSAILL